MQLSSAELRTGQDVRFCNGRRSGPSESVDAMWVIRRSRSAGPVDQPNKLHGSRSQVELRL